MWAFPDGPRNTAVRAHSCILGNPLCINLTPISRTSHAQVAWFLAGRNGLTVLGEAVPTMLVHAVPSQSAAAELQFDLVIPGEFTETTPVSCPRTTSVTSVMRFEAFTHLMAASHRNDGVAGREGETTAALLRLDRRRRLSSSAGASPSLDQPLLMNCGEALHAPCEISPTRASCGKDLKLG